MDIRDKYTAVKLLDIIRETPIPFDLHVLLKRNNKMVLFRREGQVLERDKIDLFLSKNVSELFIRLEDEEKYNDYIADGLIQVMSDPETSPEKKKTILRSSAYDLMDDIFAGTTSSSSEETVRKCSNIVKSMVYQIDNTKFSKDYRELFRMLSDEKTNKAHLLNTSSLATLFCMGLGHINHQAMTSVSMGALLHDAGLEFLPVNLINKYRNGSRLKLKEDDEIRKHVFYGIGLLQKKMPKMPEEALMIVRQHHEKADGSGYPEGLKKKRIFHLAKIVSIANDLDLLVHPLGNQQPMLPGHGLQFLYFERGAEYYDTSMLRRIMAGLNVPMEQDYNKIKTAVEE